MLNLRWAVRTARAVGISHTPKIARPTNVPKFIVSSRNSRKAVAQLSQYVRAPFHAARFTASSVAVVPARQLHLSKLPLLARWNEVPTEQDENSRELEFTSRENMAKVRQGLLLLSLPTLFLAVLWFKSFLIVWPAMMALSGITTYMSWQLSKSFFSLNVMLMLSSFKLDWSRLREYTSFAPLSLLFGAFSIFMQVQFYLPFTLRFLVLAAQLGLYGYAMSQTNWRDRIRQLIFDPDWRSGLRQLAYDIYTHTEPMLKEYAQQFRELSRRQPHGLEFHQWGDRYAETTSARIPYSMMEYVLGVLKSRSPRELDTLGYDAQINATTKQYIRRRAAQAHSLVRVSAASGFKKSNNSNYALVEGNFEIVGNGRRGRVYFVGDVNNLYEISTSLQDKHLELKYVGLELLPASASERYLPTTSNKEVAKVASKKSTVHYIYSSPKNLL